MSWTGLAMQRPSTRLLTRETRRMHPGIINILSLVQGNKKICIFTDTGVMHQIKMLDIPAGKYKDKGTPIDNLGNYDSSDEAIIAVLAAEAMTHDSLFFATEQGMLKIVSGNRISGDKENSISNKTVGRNNACLLGKATENRRWPDKTGYGNIRN